MLTGQTIGSGAYRFEIGEELGSGAMGMVYRANFHKDGKILPVALKIVNLGLIGNEGAMARFDREANILKQLRHPHIVRLYATGAYRKTPFIAMELIEGEALDRILTRRGRLGWQEVVAYGKQLCEALQYAHEKGIIHRDLKPSNLMITREGAMKLTDFGIAKDTDVTALTGMNSTIGTAAYMSPEQCKGDRNLTNKSDLYSLGIVFYELLTGKKPFYAETTVDMFLKHVNEKPPRIGKQVSELPPKLEALIQQLMEKDKEDRPTDAAWVARMLVEVEEDAFARKSAGLDVAGGRSVKVRNVDGSKLDEEDREAARALRGKKKKAKKKAVVPFFEQPRVKAAGIVLLLLVIAVGGYLAFRPPSAEKLARAIEEANSPEAKLEAATKYLERYGDAPGEATDKATAVFRESATRRREEQLNRRFINRMLRPEESDDKETLDLTWQAMDAEKAGDLRRAAELWNKVRARFPEEAKLSYSLKDDALAKARWGWVADKRLADIRKVDDLALTTRKKIEHNRRFEIAFSNEVTGAEPMAIRAMRLDEFGDKEKASRVWDQLATMTEKEADKHDWFLLASRERGPAAKSTEEGAKQRTGRIAATLKEADELLPKAKAQPESDPSRVRVRTLYREVVDLYDDETDSDIKAQVRHAKASLESVPQKG